MRAIAQGLPWSYFCDTLRPAGLGITVPSACSQLCMEVTVPVMAKPRADLPYWVTLCANQVCPQPEHSQVAAPWPGQAEQRVSWAAHPHAKPGTALSWLWGTPFVGHKESLRGQWGAACPLCGALYLQLQTGQLMAGNLQMEQLLKNFLLTGFAVKREKEGKITLWYDTHT